MSSILNPSVGFVALNERGMCDELDVFGNIVWDPLEAGLRACLLDVRVHLSAAVVTPEKHRISGILS